MSISIMSIVRHLGALNYRLSSRSRQLKFDVFGSLMKPWPGCSILSLGTAAAQAERAFA